MQFFPIVGLQAIILTDFLETAAPAFHIFEAAENVCKHRVTAARLNAHDVTILNRFVFVHSSGRGNLYAVVEDVNMYLAADFNVRPVYESVYQSLKDALFRISG